MRRKRCALSYFVFGLLLCIVLYTISTQKFGEVNTLEPRNSPLGDIFIFLLTFSVSTVSTLSSFIQGRTPDITLPLYLGRTIIILIPIWMGLSFIAGITLRTASSSITREDRSLYLLLTSRNRSHVYTYKNIGSIITGTPIAIMLVAGVAWICNDMNIDTLVLRTFIVSLVTLILFASLGMMISVLKKEEEDAVHLGDRIIKSFQLLLVLWLISPLISVLPLKRFASMIEVISMVSPITLDIAGLYHVKTSIFWEVMIVQIVASMILFGGGVYIFNRRDINY
jgi:hypothetical protein